jgi:hypothetical protein
MTSAAEKLYKELLEAESSGASVAKISEITQRLNQELSGRPAVDLSPRDAAFKKFFESLRHKPFMKAVFQSVKEEQVPSLTLAKALSSYITHALIEMEKESADRFYTFDIQEAAVLLDDVLSGERPADCIQEFFKERFG